ncbi:MAG: hypothetical protein MR629_03160, partial [Helicobacter sp.]|nr:hypothetical protein [Helicobacter sp.]
MKPTYAPKFISTIAALSLCVSSAVAHHPDTNWVITGSTENTHTGNSGSSNTDGTTTITNLESGKKIITQDSATGTISSLLISKETNNNGNPTLEIGSKNNNNKITVPNVTIEQNANLNRTIQDQQDRNGAWNILIRGGSTIENFMNNGTISSTGKADTLYLFTDEQTKNSNQKGGQTAITNFTNNGTIESKGSNAAIRLQGARIDNFKNKQGKLISGDSEEAIKVERKGTNGQATNSTITNFTNEGTIKANNTAVNFNNASITNFTNSGTIINEGNKNSGVNINDTTITSFSNSGTIKITQGAAAVRLWGDSTNVSTFINEVGGLIQSDQENTQYRIGDEVKAAIYAHSGKNITSLENKGTVKGKNIGIYIWGKNDQTITHLKNSGLIEITSNGNNNSSGGSNGSGGSGSKTGGIVLGNYDNHNAKYDTIQNTGTIKGGDYGIYTEGATITNFKNSGTIEGKIDGIGFYNAGTTNTSITNLDIEKGIIKGGTNGINISKEQGSDTIAVQNLTIGQNAIVEGKSGSGIVLGKANGQPKTNGKGTYKLTGKIEVNGTLKGSTAGITNHGELGSDNQEAIVVGNGGQIIGVVKNESGGNLKGNITNNSASTLSLESKGTVGNNMVITNSNANAGGKVEIKDWKVENQGNGNGGGQNKIKTVELKGKNITVDNLTINVQNTDVTQVADSFKVSDGANKSDVFARTEIKSNENGVTFTGDMLRGLVANIDGSKTAAAALNRTLIATATARATFLDTVMGNALNTLSFLHHRANSSLGSYKNANLYANATTIRNDLLSQSSSYASNKNNLFFVLPYYSYT